MNKCGSERLDIARLRREITIMESLSHPHIVKLYRVIETDSIIALVLEFMPGGDLCDTIKVQRWQKVVCSKFFTTGSRISS